MGIDNNLNLNPFSKFQQQLKNLVKLAFMYFCKNTKSAPPLLIAGNNYKPSAELWIRWLQANIFMPAVQFSIVPWSYSETPELSEITKSMLAIRQAHWGDILTAVNQTILDGTPIVRPVWWVDPDDAVTYTIDDQYILGDGILVAPVLTEGSTSRDVYLPTGTWTNEAGESYEGPLWIYNYAAPLDVLPYFKKSMIQ